MKSVLILALGLVALVALRCSGPRAPEQRASAGSLAEARRRFVDEVLLSIAGKEELQASEVFENVELLQRVPAGRLLRIMDIGFARSLGVGCEHCHDTDDWPSDDKRPKRATREMMEMVQTINGELLAGLENLDPDRPANSRPTVNCTTCHRGDVKPALDFAE